MKKLFLYLVFLIALLVIFGSCTTTKVEYISKDNEIYGTWVNSDYNALAPRVCLYAYPETA